MTGQAERVGNRRNFLLLRARQFVRAFADNFMLIVAIWLAIAEENLDQPVNVHAT
jgi:hypothetical protein